MFAKPLASTGRTAVWAPLLSFIAVDVLKGFVWPNLDGLAFFALDAFCLVLLPAVLFWLYIARIGFSMKSLYLYDLNSTKSRLTSLELAVAAISFTIAALVLDRLANSVGNEVSISLPSILPRPHWYQDHQLQSPLGHFISALYYSVSAGIAEEFIFRGVLRSVMALTFPEISLAGYILLSAVLSSIVHFSHGLANVIEAFLDSLVFATAYAKVKDLRPMIVAHCAIDFGWFV